MAWTLVTGGAKRLGEQLCYALAQQGRSVVVHYHQSQREAQAVVKQCEQWGVQAAAIKGDFSTVESTVLFARQYAAQFPNTENLINNVGNYLMKSTLQTSVQEWIGLFQTNLHTPFILVKELLPSLSRLKGNVINIGMSGLDCHRAFSYASAYNMTKAGLLMLTRSLAQELAPEGVRVNMISPGYLDNSVDLPDSQALPMHRPAECWEICRVANFLLHPDSAYLTGQNIEIAGGVGLS